MSKEEEMVLVPKRVVDIVIEVSNRTLTDTEKFTQGDKPEMTLFEKDTKFERFKFDLTYAQIRMMALESLGLISREESQAFDKKRKEVFWKLYDFLYDRRHERCAE